MFMINYNNLPNRRYKRSQKVLKHSAEDNTKMVIDLATTVTDMANIIKELTAQVTELTAVVAATAEDSDDEDDEEEDI